MNDKEFEAKYRNALLESDPEFSQNVLDAYVVPCERYDSYTCTGKRNGESIPLNGKELVAVNKNAQLRIKDLESKGYERAEITKEIQRFNIHFPDIAKDYLNRS